MDPLDDPPKKTSKATIVRRVVVGLLALACAGGWIYTRYLVVKRDVGGACSYDIHCKPDAPRCLKQAVDGEGVCSRPCDTDEDCAADIRCVKVELEELDERGRPLQGGYCFPQALLDARRARLRGDAGAARSDAWLEAPKAPGQLEGEITIDRGGAKTTYEVKGTLVRASRPHGRTIADASTLRVYSVDDEKKTFSASQLAARPGEPKVTKTERSDRVAERACEIWQIEEPGAPGREACVVTGAAFVDPGARTVSAWEKELTVRGVFPLRVTEGGKTRLVVTKIDAKPLDAAGFSIPKAYKNLAAR